LTPAEFLKTDREHDVENVKKAIFQAIGHFSMMQATQF